jgi:hypothetical protein
VDLDDLLSEGIDRNDALDGRMSVPREWRWMGLAVLGQPEREEWADRLLGGALSRGSLSSDEMVERLATRTKASGYWSNLDGSDDEPSTVGIFGTGMPPSDAHRLLRWRSAAMGDPAELGTGVLLDTTTVYTAIRLVEADDLRDVTPLTVMDLATFLSAACVYERVCYLENPYFGLADLERLFGEGIFLELPVSSSADPDSPYSADFGHMAEPLRTLYRRRTVPWLNNLRLGQLGAEPQRDAWVRAWQTILGREVDPTWLLLDPDEGKDDRYPDSWSTDAVEMLASVVEAMTDDLARSDIGPVTGERSGRVPWAQQANARALCNLVLADFLRVSYQSSAARLPILALIADCDREERRSALRFPRAVRLLEDLFAEQTDTFLSAERDYLHLPFFPSAILQRTDRPGLIPAVLAEVRAATVGFREKLCELDARLWEGDHAAYKEMRAALAGSRPKAPLAETAEVGVFVADLALLPPDPHTHLVGWSILLVKAMLASRAVRDLSELFRPKYRLLGSLRPMPNTAPSIERIWSVPDIERFAQRLSELAAVTPSL